MSIYRVGILVLLLFGMSCQSKKVNTHQNINDFVGHWVSLVQQCNITQLHECLSPDASVEATDMISSIQTANKNNISIRLDPHESFIEKLLPNQYEIVLPFVLSGPIIPHQPGAIKLSVQQDIFGTFKVTDVSGNLSVYVDAAKKKMASANSSKPTKTAISRDAFKAKAAAVQQLLINQQDSVVYYTQVDTTLLFYIARGDWDYSILTEKSKERNYQMGVVDEQGKEVIPIAFDKIYNPGGTLPHLIEVERNGKRGFYNLKGQPVISVSFDAVYPYQEDKQVLAQVKFDGRYGWLDWQGDLHLDHASHPDTHLFESPVVSNRLLQWKFETHQKDLSYLRLPDPANDHYLHGAIIITPSYLYDLGIIAEYNANILLEDDDRYGYGVEERHVSVVESTSISQQIQGLITKFVEWGADARDYHYEIDKLITLNEDLTSIATLDFQGEYHYYLPNPELSFQEPALFETKELKHATYTSYDEMTLYSYYQIHPDGKIIPLSTHRLFSFTKFIKISEANFRGEFKDHLESTTLNSKGENVNLTVASHLSMEDLDVMRNEIFAEYGYRFKSEKWQTYFGQQPWYTPQYDNVDNMLSDIDRYNVQFIYDFQEKIRGHEQEYIRRDSLYYMAAG